MTFHFLFCHTDTVICAVFRPMGIIFILNTWQRPQVGGQEAGGSLAWRWAEAFLCWTFSQGLQNGLSGNATCEMICPQDHPKNVRFAINYFTAIGLGVLTEERLLNIKNRRTWHQKHIETLKHSKSSDHHIQIRMIIWSYQSDIEKPMSIGWLQDLRTFLEQANAQAAEDAQRALPWDSCRFLFVVANSQLSSHGSKILHIST